MRQMRNAHVGVATSLVITVSLILVVMSGHARDSGFSAVPPPSQSHSTISASIGQPAADAGGSRDEVGYLCVLPSAPVSGDVGYGREYPVTMPSFSSRGGAREAPPTFDAYVTYYVLPDDPADPCPGPAPCVAGVVASYPARNEHGRRIGAYIDGYGPLPWGQTLLVGGFGETFRMWDTGMGYEDQRPWLDVGLRPPNRDLKAAEAEAIRRGASWRKVWVLGR